MSYQPPGEDRNKQPFEVKDIVQMKHEGFSMRHLDKGEVQDIRWVTGTGWCISVKSLSDNRTHSYRAMRFQFIEKGKIIMKPFYIIYETFKNLDTSAGYTANLTTAPHVVYGSEADAKTYIKDLLAKYPDRTYAYGYINRLAQTDLPPVKIINL